MFCLLLTMADRCTCPNMRQSYTREEKLQITQWHWNNGQNLYQTCKKFELNSKTILRSIKDEWKIKNSRKGRKCVQFEWTSQYPSMEDTLYKEYHSLCKQGIKIKGWWFKARAKQLHAKCMKQYPYIIIIYVYLQAYSDYSHTHTHTHTHTHAHTHAHAHAHTDTQTRI